MQRHLAELLLVFDLGHLHEFQDRHVVVKLKAFVTPGSPQVGLR
jgi:hypothetical protein